MSINDEIPGYGTYIPREPVSDLLKVHTEYSPDKQHPSARQKDYPHMSAGMAHKLKHQLAKKHRRKGDKNSPTSDGSGLTDLAEDTGEPMSGEEKFVAQQFLDGNPDAMDYFI